MSTQAIIARASAVGTFTGVLHVKDGNPPALGAALWDLYQQRYTGKLGEMLEHLIDEHPAGWMTCWGNDAQCLCHAESAAHPMVFSDQTDYLPAQYAYAFGRTSTHQPFMRVLVKLLLPDSVKRWEWFTLGIALLHGEAPDWQRLQHDAECVQGVSDAEEEVKLSPLSEEKLARLNELLQIERDALEGACHRDGSVDHAMGVPCNPESSFARRAFQGPRWSSNPAFEAAYRAIDWHELAVAAYQRGWDEYRR